MISFLLKRCGVFLSIFGLFLIFFLPSPAKALSFSKSRPKLVLFLVIDQFRSDALTLNEDHFLAPRTKKGRLGGFRFLMEQGSYFPFAEHDQLQNLTAPGHTAISTGGYPYQTGIPLNEWYHPELMRMEYCVEDLTSPLIHQTGNWRAAQPEIPSSLVKKSPADTGTQTDLDQNLAKKGRSPKNLVGTTFSDQMKSAFPESRVVSVSIKDRAAILMGGHRSDLSFWMDQEKLQWITSQYYAPHLPKWIESLNRKTQSLFEGPSGLRQESEAQLRLRHAIAGTEATAHAAQMAIEEFGLGKNSQSPDYLSVSFSPYDYLGHRFGPKSSVQRELTLETDRILSVFFNFLDRKIPGGISEVAIVLTADHGVSPSPYWSREHEIPTQRILENQLSEKMEHVLREKWGKPDSENWILGSHAMNFYLNRKEAVKKDIPIEKMEALAKTVLLRQPEVAYVQTRSDAIQQNFLPALLGKQAAHSFYGPRSGDLIVVAKPYHVSLSAKAELNATNHHTGYTYDRHVPIVFVGKAFQKKRFSTPAKVVDIVPTFSLMLGITPPATSEGRVLSESLKML